MDNEAVNNHQKESRKEGSRRRSVGVIVWRLVIGVGATVGGYLMAAREFASNDWSALVAFGIALFVAGVSILAGAFD